MKDTAQAEANVINKMPDTCHAMVNRLIRRYDGKMIDLSAFRYLVWSHLIQGGGMSAEDSEKLTLELIAAMG